MKPKPPLGLLNLNQVIFSQGLFGNAAACANEIVVYMSEAWL